LTARGIPGGAKSQTAPLLLPVHPRDPSPLPPDDCCNRRCNYCCKECCKEIWSSDYPHIGLNFWNRRISERFDPGDQGSFATHSGAHRGSPRKISEPLVYSARSTYLPGIYHLHHILSQEGKTAFHRVSRRGGGSGKGCPPPRHGVFGQPHSLFEPTPLEEPVYRVQGRSLPCGPEVVATLKARPGSAIVGPASLFPALGEHRLR